MSHARRKQHKPQRLATDLNATTAFRGQMSAEAKKSPISIEEQFLNSKTVLSTFFNGAGPVSENPTPIDLSRKNSARHPGAQLELLEDKANLLLRTLTPQQILQLCALQEADRRPGRDSSELLSSPGSNESSSSVADQCASTQRLTPNLVCPAAQCSAQLASYGALLLHVADDHRADALLQCAECEENFADIVALRKHRCASASLARSESVGALHATTESANQCRSESVPAAASIEKQFCLRSADDDNEPPSANMSSRDREEALFEFTESRDAPSGSSGTLAEENSLSSPAPPLLLNQLMGSLPQEAGPTSDSLFRVTDSDALDLSLARLPKKRPASESSTAPSTSSLLPPLGPVPGTFTSPILMPMNGMPTLTPPSMSSSAQSPLGNEDDWEAYMEVSLSDEYEKIRALVGDKPQPTKDPNECIVCHRILSCKSALQMHYRTHTGDRPFKCKMCGRAFTTKGNLKTHMGVHRAKNSVRGIGSTFAGMGMQCRICQKRFLSPPQFQQHMAQHSTQLTRNGLFGSPQPTSSPTAHTPKTEPVASSPATPTPFLTPSWLPTTSMSPFPGSALPFLPALLNFPSPFAMAVPSVASNAGNGLVPRESKPNAVKDALKMEAALTPIKLSSGLDSRPVPATPLKRGPTTTSSSTPELKSFSAEQLRIADFRTPVKAEEKSVDHANSATPKPNRCEISGSAVPTPTSSAEEPSTPSSVADAKPEGVAKSSKEDPLAAIQKMYSEAEPVAPARRSVALSKHQCGVCFKHFSSSSALQIHMRTHTGDKPFKCDTCERAFTTRGNLKVHVQSVHSHQRSPSRRGRRIFDFPSMPSMATAALDSPGQVNSRLPAGLGAPHSPFPRMLLSPLAAGFQQFFAHAGAQAQMEALMKACMFRAASSNCPMCQTACASPLELEAHLKTHIGQLEAASGKENNEEKSTALPSPPPMKMGRISES